MELLTPIVSQNPPLSFHPWPTKKKPNGKLSGAKQPPPKFKLVQAHKSTQISHKNSEDFRLISSLSTTSSSWSYETPEPSLPTATTTTFVVPRTDEKIARVLTIIRNRSLPIRQARPAAMDFYIEDDVSIIPEQYLRENEPAVTNKKEEEESAVYDRLYRCGPQVATQSAKEDCAVAALPVGVEGFEGLDLDANVKDEEQAYGLDTALGPPMHVFDRTT